MTTFKLDSSSAQATPNFWNDFGASIKNIGASISEGMAKIFGTLGITSIADSLKTYSANLRASILNPTSQQTLLTQDVINKKNDEQYKIEIPELASEGYIPRQPPASLTRLEELSKDEVRKASLLQPMQKLRETGNSGLTDTLQSLFISKDQVNSMSTAINDFIPTGLIDTKNKIVSEATEEINNIKQKFQLK